MSIDDLKNALLQCADVTAWSTADAIDWWESEFEGIPAADDSALFEESSAGDSRKPHTDGTVVGNEDLGATPR